MHDPKPKTAEGPVADSTSPSARSSTSTLTETWISAISEAFRKRCPLLEGVAGDCGIARVERVSPTAFALIYEIVWQRMFALVFEVSTWSTTAVLAAYMERGSYGKEVTLTYLVPLVLREQRHPTNAAVEHMIDDLAKIDAQASGHATNPRRGVSASISKPDPFPPSDEGRIAYGRFFALTERGLMGDPLSPFAENPPQ